MHSAPRTPAVVGVDLGGSWLRIKALTLDAKVYRQSHIPAPSLNDFPKVLTAILKLWKCRPRRLVVASKGIWTPREQELLRQRLAPLATHVSVMPDVEAAWRGAFVDYGSEDSRMPSGVLLIAGTGSIALGRDEDGRLLRAGGLGPLLGDEGSAFWIGRAWARHRGERIAGASVASIAKLSRKVFSQAIEGDSVARFILKDAQKALATLVQMVARKGRWSRTIRWSSAGGLWKIPGFQEGVQKRLGQKYRWTAPRQDALTSAALESLIAERRIHVR